MPELGSNDPYFGYDMGKHGLEDRKNSREKFVNFYPAIGDRMFEQRVCINFQSGRHYHVLVFWMCITKDLLTSV